MHVKHIFKKFAHCAIGPPEKNKLVFVQISVKIPARVRGFLPGGLLFLNRNFSAGYPRLCFVTKTKFQIDLWGIISLVHLLIAS